MVKWSMVQEQKISGDSTNLQLRVATLGAWEKIHTNTAHASSPRIIDGVGSIRVRHIVGLPSTHLVKTML